MRDIDRARQQMGARLKELRLDARMTGRQLAARYGWQASKVSKLENGRQTPSEDDIHAWCDAVGRSGEAANLIATLRAMETLYAEWRRQLRLGTKTRQQSWAEIEAEITNLRVFESVLVPGLLQTSEYARLRLSQVIAFHGIPDDLEEGVAARMRRQEVLYNPAKTFHFVILESALRLGMAPPDVMLGQLDRLIAITMMPRVHLGIVPMRAPLPFAPQHGFWIFGDRAVHVETVAAELTLTLSDEIEQYARLFDWFTKAAHYGPHARRIITQTMEDLSE
ncbi:helix-turn-helix domain-containing protein [Streptosporangium sp. CA-135522]|uniref:helix-turn-helix domain-containing protein n=1 Tax=Streptosporangium sp. CA-135522 TaxID=3240072 RepID=UPI003D94DE7F